MLRQVPRDNGWQNVVRQVPNGAVLYMPGLDYGNWHTDTILDYSGQGNNGTIAGTTTKFLPSGLAYLNFDGSDDYVDLGDNAAFELNTFTILAWVKRSAVDASHCIASLQEQGGGASGLCGVILRFEADNTLRGLVCIANAFETVTTVATYGTSWMLAGLSKTETAVEITVNGVSVKTGTLTSATVDYSTTTTKKTSFGGLWNATAASFDSDFAGGIPLPRILNVAKTATQILNYYNQERALIGV